MTLTPSDIVAKTGELPTLPHVATKVMELVGDPATSAKDIQDVIITDQGMTGQILKIANSAMFGMKREVKTLTHAIMLLGFTSIRSIVLAAASKKIYAGRGGAPGFKEKLIWENSIGSALIARGVAEQFSDLDKEEAFIGGLMHNLGKTIFNAKMPDAYGEVMAEAYNSKEPIEELERKRFGFDHAELGSYLLQQWNLSDSLASAVRWYLAPEQASVETRRLAAVVGISAHFCLDLGLGVATPVPLDEQNLGALPQILSLDEARLAKWREIIHRKMEQDSAMIKGF